MKTVFRKNLLILLLFTFTISVFGQDTKKYYTYKGYIKTYSITMKIRFYEGYDCKRGGSLIEGYYYYDKSGAKNRLLLNGYACGASLYLTEKNKKGEVTGSFIGVLDADKITGVWKNSKNNKELDFNLTESK